MICLGTTEVIDLLPVPNVLGQFLIIEPPRIIQGPGDCLFGRGRHFKEAPHLSEEALARGRVNAMMDDLKETPTATRIVESSNQTGFWFGEIDNGYLQHIWIRSLVFRRTDSSIRPRRR
jgi:hypothetical protein